MLDLRPQWPPVGPGMWKTYLQHGKPRSLPRIPLGPPGFRSAALRSRANPRAVAVAQALAGLSMVAGVLIRIYQPADPGRQVWSLLETKLTEGGIALGWLASAIRAPLAAEPDVTSLGS
jgi:hypothetical protein